MTPILGVGAMPCVAPQAESMKDKSLAKIAKAF